MMARLASSVLAGALALSLSLPLRADGVEPVAPSEVRASVLVYVFVDEDVRQRPLSLEIDGERHEVASLVQPLRVELPLGEHRVALWDDERQLGAFAFTAGVKREIELIVDVTDAGVVFEVEGADPADAPVRGGAPEVAVEPGRVRGRVVSLEEQRPVEGVSVNVRGSAYSAVTAADGTYEVKAPAGTQALSFVHGSYSATVQDGVEVVSNQSTELNVELTPAALELDEFTVAIPLIHGSVAAALDERKNASTITEVLGAEEMSRSGDSDAAGALSRVTGLTIVDGRYVYVRGLGERYSSTLLNGSTLPSPEPERRVVPLDLFPTGVLESVVIRKTYSPELPGEFGGGTVELKTRRYPEEFMLQLGVTGGALLGTTLSEGLVYPGGLLDVAGIDDGTRALPAAVREASDGSPLLERDRFSTRGYTASELERLGEKMDNVWSAHTATLPPDFGASAQIGDRFVLGDLEAGYYLGLSYGNEWKNRSYRREFLLVGQDGGLERGHAYDFDTTTHEVGGGGLFSAGLSWKDDHQIAFTTVFGRSTEDEARVYEGFNRDVGGDIRVTRLRWIERTLLAQQVTGLHRIRPLWNLEVDWRYTYALASRYEPDRREIRKDREGDGDRWLLSDRPEGNQRVFSDLLDHNHDGALVLRLLFSQWTDEEGKVEVGASVSGKTRGVDTRRYKFQHKGGASGDADVLALEPEQIFTPQNISSDGFQFEEITRQTDNYTASQVVGGGFTNGVLPLGWGFVVAGGLRVEHARQNVSTFELFNPDGEPVSAELVTTDFLPAASLSWEVIEGMKLRAGSSITVSRPDFRELSPATFNDVTGGRQTFGNPDLERALIYAGDLRWEYYPVSGTQLSVAGFYKHFDSPIEQVVVVSAQHSVTFANALAADNVGAELELRTDFGWIHEWLEGAFVAGNGALIYSRVSLDESSGIQTSKERALQGQSPYVLNLQAGYDQPDLGTRAVVLYNVFGPRIAEVGALGAADIYEEPFHRLDLVLSQRLPWGFSVGLKAKNLLDLAARHTQGGEEISAVTYGRSVSLSLGWTY